MLSSHAHPYACVLSQEQSASFPYWHNCARSFHSNDGAVVADFIQICLLAAAGACTPWLGLANSIYAINIAFPLLKRQYTYDKFISNWPTLTMTDAL